MTHTDDGHLGANERPYSRRDVLIASAWSAPIVALSTATPAVAASNASEYVLVNMEANYNYLVPGKIQLLYFFAIERVDGQLMTESFYVEVSTDEGDQVYELIDSGGREVVPASGSMTVPTDDATTVTFSIGSTVLGQTPILPHGN